MNIDKLSSCLNNLDITFTDTWPCEMNIPLGGIPLGNLTDFVKSVLGGKDGMGHSGISDVLDPFFNLMPNLNGVYLTRLEVGLDNNAESVPLPFFVGFQLRESWNIISDSGLPHIPALVVSDPGFTIGSPGSDAGYTVDVYGTLEIFGVELQVIVQWPAMIITGTLVRELNLTKLLSETGFEGDVAFSKDDKNSGLTIRAMMLRLDHTNKAMDLSFGLGGWDILPNKLKLNNLLLDLSTSPEHKSASVRAQMDICGINIDLSGTFYDGQLELAGGLSSGEEISIIDLVKIFDKDAILPATLDEKKILNLRVSFNTQSKDFTFTGEVKFPVDDKDLDMILTIEIKHQQDGSFSKHFSGKITIDGLEFDVIFDSKSGSATFIASYNDPKGHPIKVQDLVKKVSPSIGENVPGSLNFTIKDALLAYQSKGTEKNYLFGIDIDGGLNLSDLKLPDLPLVGPPFPPEQTLKLSFQLLAAKVAFTKDQVYDLNALLPSSKLPDKEITKGLGLSTVLQVGTEYTPVSLPLDVNKNTDQSTTGKETTSTPSPDVQETNTGLAKAGEDESTKWISLQKNFGPVHLERIGLAYKDSNITGLLDAALVTGGLTISLSGLSFSSPLTELKPTFDLHGLGIQYRNGGLEIGGAFLKQQMNGITSFGGLATIRTEKLALSAIGSYAKVNDNPSLFIYAVLDYPIGGPPFFFVTGLAAGFGYNRNLIVPTLDNLREFPLVEEATRSGGPPKLPSGQKEQQDTLTKELTKLEKYIPPAVGQNFLAIGIKFTSFKIIDSFALLTVKFGDKLEFDLLGLSTLKSPPDSPTPIAEAQLVLKATFIPEDGFLGVQAELAPNSYILSKACHLTGGFAFFSWFKDSPDGKIKGGDFVLTLGGYHPQFVKPPHYPIVPRLGINWQVSKPSDPYQLSIKGEAYFALTPHALMAGGRLEALWQMGDLRAWFIANADFLINWLPYHYDARLYVNIGASYTFEFFGRHTITVDLGADLHIWGPEFSGTATIDAHIFKINIEFGDKTTPKLEPIGWEKSNAKPGFKNSFLPADDQICSIAVQGGLVRQIEGPDGSQRWIINPKDLVLVTNSVIPANIANIQGSDCINKKDNLIWSCGKDNIPISPIPFTKSDKVETYKQTVETRNDTTHVPITQVPIGSIGISPMRVSSNDLNSTHTVEITRDGEICKDLNLKYIPLFKTVPSAMWGEPQMDVNGNLLPPKVNPEKTLVKTTLAGFEIRSANQPTSGCTNNIDKDMLMYVGTPYPNAYQWTMLAGDAKQGKEAWTSANETIMDDNVKKKRMDLISNLKKINKFEFSESVFDFGEPVTQDVMVKLD